MNYQTESHRNYYAYCKLSPTIRKLRKASRSQSCTRRDDQPETSVKRTLSLPAFTSPVKSDVATDSSSVRSYISDSVSSESKSGILTLKCIRKKLSLRGKTKSFDPIVPKKTSTVRQKTRDPRKAKYFKAKNKIKNWFYFFKSPSFWAASKPVLFPTSRSLSELIESWKVTTKPAEISGDKNQENTKSEVAPPSQSLPRQPAKPSTTQKKDTSCPDSPKDSKSTTASKTETGDKRSFESPSKAVKNTTELKDSNSKDEEDTQNNKEEDVYYSYPDHQYSVRKRRKRLLPDLERLGLRPEDGIRKIAQRFPFIRIVTYVHDSKYTEFKGIVAPEDLTELICYTEENSKKTRYTSSEPVDTERRERPRRLLPDLELLGLDINKALRKPNIRRALEGLYIKTYDDTGKEYYQQPPDGAKSNQQLQSQSLKENFGSKSDADPERIEKVKKYQSEGDKRDQFVQPQLLGLHQSQQENYNQAQHGAIKRQLSQHVSRQQYSEGPKQQEAKTEPAKHGALNRQEHQHFQHIKQYPCNIETLEHRKVRFLPVKSKDDHSDGDSAAKKFTRSTIGAKDHYRIIKSHMGRMDDHERKVIIEFCHLLEKSKQLFNGLRELPQYGHKQWHSYFGRTFDVYTKLWKFQQQHRAVLDSKYGLKRWQIGEIASKIGQLYYHFYLRTSETAYLNEAFSFYYAIRGRSYYTKACKEDKCELMVKKLRYYARFIVVCLLLKKIKLVRELLKELDRQIIEYGNTYDPDDQIEWAVVVDEVKSFIHAEPVVSVIHPDNYPVILSHRLSSLTTPPVERTSQMTLSLQEVLIIGSSSQQVKFSELTMDMFRMLQTLEREPTGDIQHMFDDSPRQRFNLTPSVLNNKGYNLETAAPRSENPHKYLLFKPSPSQVLVYLASGCNDLPPNGTLLLYISANGQIAQSAKHSEDGYDVGGVITTSRNDLYRDTNKERGNQAKSKEVQCLYPGDLYPFTRRSLFVIVDSDNSYVFQSIPRHFGQPLLILMSPMELPTSLQSSSSDRKQQGSLFTLFLHSPLTAFCYCCDVHTIPLGVWERAQGYIDTFLAEASQLLTRSRIDTTFLSFMGDDFLRVLILRFIFCEVVLRMHRSFRARTQLTRSSPPIPDDVLEHPALTHIIMDLASHLQVRGNLLECPPNTGPPPA